MLSKIHHGSKVSESDGKLSLLVNLENEDASQALHAVDGTSLQHFQRFNIVR